MYELALSFTSTSPMDTKANQRICATTTHTNRGCTVMTTQEQKALELALEALQHMCYHTRAKVGYKSKIVETAITIIEEALAVDKESLTTEAQQSQCAAKMSCGATVSNVYEAYEAGKLASLAQQSNEQVEPIGEVVTAGVICWKDKYPSFGTKLYTHPPVPTAQPKPLTIEQIERIHDRYGGNMVNCVRAIERQHGIKE